MHPDYLKRSILKYRAIEGIQCNKDSKTYLVDTESEFTISAAAIICLQLCHFQLHSGSSVPICLG